MSDDPDVPTNPTLDVDDHVLAKIAAFEAVQTPGVARLHPYVVAAARNAVSSVAKRATAKLAGADDPPDTTPAAAAADPAAVDVSTEDGRLTLTIRIVATTTPPILGVIRELQQRVNSRITEVTGTAPLVIVNVLDIEPLEDL